MGGLSKNSDSLPLVSHQPFRLFLRQLTSDAVSQRAGGGLFNWRRHLIVATSLEAWEWRWMEGFMLEEFE